MQSRIILFAFLALFTLQTQAQKEEQRKMLVTYFTLPEREGVDASSGASRIIENGKLVGATEYVAKTIAEVTGADMFQIKTTHTYPAAHKALIDYAKDEADSKTYPKISSEITNFADYDVVFVGYPNWWYDMPMVIYTLFSTYDFSGKTIVPFCTHGGSGFSQSVQTIKQLEVDATIVSIPAIARDNVAQSRKGIENWLQKNGFANK